MSVGASFLSGNSAAQGGGARLASPARLTNCVIAGNQGNALHTEYASPSLVNCTITGNRHFFPLVVSCQGNGRAALLNCILWANSSQDVCADLDSCLLDSDPLFCREGVWDDNGTPDKADDHWIDGDYHLTGGSPAIDAGSSEGAPTTDIEEQGRPCGTGVEVGAYEYCPPAGFLRGDANADGKSDIGDAVTVLGFLFLGGPMNSCGDAADVNDDGRLEISDPVRLLRHLFSGSEPPPEPFGTCGGDPTADELDCKAFSKCR